MAFNEQYEDQMGPIDHHRMDLMRVYQRHIFELEEKQRLNQVSICFLHVLDDF